MEASGQVVPQIEKKQYKNNTGGWLGVVTLDHQGKELGVSIEPYGTIWLSDAEAILTARAPKDPANNPFEEQEFMGKDENGAVVPVRFRPLTLHSDESRYVPSNDRYVPGISEAEGKALAQQAATSADPGPITPEAAARSAEIVAAAQAAEAQPAAEATPAAVEQPPAVPADPMAAPVEQPPAPVPAVAPETAAPVMQGTPAVGLSGENPSAASDEAESWVGEPEAPGEVLQGSLQGDAAPVADVPAPEGAPEAALPAQSVATAPGGNADAPAPPAEDFFAQAAPAAAPAPEGTPDEAPQGAGEAPVGEETAAAVDPAVGEETGAAQPPAAPAPEGEFAQAEEVGSPDAPTQTGDGSSAG